MEYSDQPDPDKIAPGSGLPPVGVFVSARQAQALQEQADAATRILMLIRAVEAGEAVPFDKLGGLAVAVLEVDPADRRSVDRLSQLTRSRPSFPVIAAIASPDMALVKTLVREGVADVVSLPLSVPELTQACLDAVARQAQPTAEIQLAPLIGVVRSNGGCGATTVATHLGTELAAQLAGATKVVLADLDLQYGSVAAYLGASRGGALPDLISSQERVDEEMLRVLAPEGPGGLAVLCAPDAIPSSDSISLDGLLRAVEALRKIYGLVVIDFPPNWSNWSASVAFSANLLLVVTELSLGSIRSAKRCIDLFDVIGIDRAKVQIVANKVEKKLFKPIDVSDLSGTLGRKIAAVLPKDTADLSRAQDQGLPVGLAAKRNAFATAVTGLAQSVREEVGLGGRT